MKKYYDLADKLWRDLCAIPAPSYHEEKRAKYICDTLLSWGAAATIDDAKNVLLKIEGDFPETVVFAAHTGTVFPDTEPLPFREDETKVYCPGAGDDTASCAILMSAAKYLIDRGETPKNTLVIALNSREEGLGNLKGVKKIVETYGKDMKAFYTFDGTYDTIANESVGSHRYRVTVRTEGGHSYQAFGNKNAAEILSRGISRIYDISAPQEKGKTTYNVGMICGGTSVNSIVQQAEMLCEYRSVSYENLAYMEENFREVFDYMTSLGATVEVALVGERPCMKDVDLAALQKMSALCKNIQENHTGLAVKEHSASTDCNIPLSMGIPSLCVGSYMGGGAHTREEWVEKASIPKGFDIVKDIILHYCKEGV